jgi:Protein of unknown function (DUF2950)
MKGKQMMSIVGRWGRAGRLALGFALAVALSPAMSAPGAESTQRTFTTPEEAVEALVAAAKAKDMEAVIAILGPESKALVTSGDPVADETARERFVTSYEQKHTLVRGEEDATVLETGDDGWPFPIPLVDTDRGWRFDGDEGVQEVIDRRIGANELYTIQTCLAYVDAQREYNDRNPQGDAVPPYAQFIASSKGKKDGLYWETGSGEPPSPLGALFARAHGEGYAPAQGKRVPYHGYVYRVLKAQGPNAPGGAYDYVLHGKMIGGFALVAYPAEYDSSGVMTFLVNHSGDVYEKDLGAETEAIAGAMKTFDPDDTWVKVDAKDLPIPTAEAS